MEDFLVSLSINDLYKSSKNTTWRKQVLEKSIVIYKFLKEHKLIIVDPFDENGNLKRVRTDKNGYIFANASDAYEDKQNQDSTL